jgi:transposase-like protein
MPKRAVRGSWSQSRRWTEREASEALAALERSGESLAAFAEQEGLSVGRLYRWRARLMRMPAFVEIRPEVVADDDGAGVLEVVVATGHVVRVPPDFNAAALRRLLAVLEGAAC